MFCLKQYMCLNTNNIPWSWFTCCLFIQNRHCCRCASRCFCVCDMFNTYIYIYIYSPQISWNKYFFKNNIYIYIYIYIYICVHCFPDYYFARPLPVAWGPGIHDCPSPDLGGQAVMTPTTHDDEPTTTTPSSHPASTLHRDQISRSGEPPSLWYSIYGHI